MKKKILSAILAIALVATTAVPVFAGAVPQDQNYYYINDDFSNYTYLATNTSNDGISNWRIEYGDNADSSAVVSKADLVIETVTKLDDALKLADCTTANKTIRAGRLLDKKIGVGETLSVEFDIYANESAAFVMGLESAMKTNEIEDSLGSIVFGTVAGDTNLYYESLQRNYLSNAKSTYTGLEFAYGEVNHVKIDYTLTSSEDDTKDSVTVTLSNSKGQNQTCTKSTNFRSTADATTMKLTGIIGVNFTKSIAGEVYIDNFKAYQTGIGKYNEYALINQNCDNAVNDTTKQANNFYLENGDNAAAASGVFTTTTGKDGTANGAVKITPGTTVYAHRGVIPFENVIQPEGKTLKLSFDIKAPSFTATSGNGDQFVMGFVSNTAKEDRRAAAPFAIGTQATAGALDIKYGDNANRQNLGNVAWGLSLEPSVWNHVEIEYTFATDMDSYTLGSWGGSAWNDTTVVGTPANDAVKMTITKSDGTTATATKNIASRAHGAANSCQLTDIYGLGIYAAQNATYAYELDNIKVVAEEVSAPTATIAKASDTTVTVTFSEDMSDKYSKLDGIKVMKGTEEVEMTGALGTDKKTYTLTSATAFDYGQYTVTAPASVISLVGVPAKAASYSFKKVPESDSFTVTPSILAAGDATVEVLLTEATKTKYNSKNIMLIIAEYAEGGALQNAYVKALPADYKLNHTFTLGTANSYKAFVWEENSISPLFDAK